jgi:LysR family transcriptional regulator (chromosome initiation inhibitor)
MRAPDPAALDCLLALIDEGSFERAARRLSITQSAVSQRLRALEEQLGQRVLVRERPLRLTPTGTVLLRHARQMQALQGELARELDDINPAAACIAVAVNADSLATWVLPALDPLVREGLLLELVVDDQDFTHEWLREGRVLGCVSTVSEPLNGCRVTALGVMPYVAAASPGFIDAQLGGRADGLTPANFAQLPFVVFNRKDDLQAQWVERVFGVREPRLVERFVPSSEAFMRAVALGWGIGMLPLAQAREALARGELVALQPRVPVDVALYWHQWRLGEGEGEAGGPAAHPRRAHLLDRIGSALAAGVPRATDVPA